MPFYMTEEQLACMAFDHKYASSGATLLDSTMQIFWNYVVTLLPLKHNPEAWIHWSAPNTMTLGGLVCMIVPTLLLVASCLDVEPLPAPERSFWGWGTPPPPPSQPAWAGGPAWAYALSALGLFVYQTLDAIDGKQARRTGCQSSFGELFDHGCDALSTIFGTLGTVLCLQSDKSFLSFGVMLCAYLTFAGAHVQTYFKGCLQFGLIDVTEIQLSGMMIMIVCSVQPDYWTARVNGVPLSHIPILVTYVTSLVVVVLQLYDTATCKHVPHAKTSPLELWTGVLAIPTIALAWFAHAKDAINAVEFILLIIAVGLVNASHSCSLILAHMSHSALSRTSYLRIMPMAGCAAANALGLMSAASAVRLCFAVNLLTFLHFSIAVSRQISAFLGISVFKVTKATAVDFRKRLK